MIRQLTAWGRTARLLAVACFVGTLCCGCDDSSTYVTTYNVGLCDTLVTVAGDTITDPRCTPCVRRCIRESPDPARCLRKCLWPSRASDPVTP